jgi:hypothetical protein
VNSSAQPLKCVGKTERISSQIFIDLFFNQDVAMRTTARAERRGFNVNPPVGLIVIEATPARPRVCCQIVSLDLGRFAMKRSKIR